MYSDIVNAYDAIIYLHMEVTNLEKILYCEYDNNTATMFIKTAMLKLKPELELYNLIIGRPIKGETYKIHILN